MFLLNSRLGLFSAATFRSYREGNHELWLPFFRSYGDNLPSSLTRVLSRALEYSSCQPVSVLVRSPSATRAYFSEALRYAIGSPRGFPLVTAWNSVGGFTYPTILTVPRTYPIVRALNVLRQPIVIALGGTGIFNPFSIAYAFRPRLRGRLTQGRRALPWNPSAFGEEDSHLLYRVLMPCIITSIRSTAPYGTASVQILRSPTTQNKVLNP